MYGKDNWKQELRRRLEEIKKRKEKQDEKGQDERGEKKSG